MYLWYYTLFAIFVINKAIEQLADDVGTEVNSVRLISADVDFDDELLKRYKKRCTRRFTPGVCVEPIVQVWTFDFQLMNCTERLGCPQSTRSNRFTTLETCVRRCQPMVDLYLQILAFGGTDSSSRFFLRKIPDFAALRSGKAFKLPPPPPEEDHYPGDEALLARIMYPDAGAALDDVPQGRDANDYLELHDPANWKQV